MRPRLWRGFAVLAVFALMGAACSDNSSTTTGSSGGASSGGGSCTSDIKVGLALDVGGLGDNGFNDLANLAVQKAIDDGVICKENTKLIEANSEGTNLDENVQSLADAGYDLIIGTGYAFTSDGKINEIAPDYPDTDFAIIDGYATACGESPEDCGLVNPASAIPNVLDLTFKEQEGSYLVGVAAALKAQALKCDNVGFLGGQTGYLIGKFEAGYRAGVAEIDPKMTVQVEYIGDTTKAFDDATAGEALSNKMYDNGACIIYHAAGDSGNGLFKAAAAQGKLAIGVDSDQYLTADPKVKDVIMTSMLKKVDVAVYDFITSVNDDKFTAGTTTYDLAKDGVGYATSGGQVDDIKTQLEAAKAKIISGEITVPTK
jgi:basic membrane protein A